MSPIGNSIRLILALNTTHRLDEVTNRLYDSFMEENKVINKLLDLDNRLQQIETSILTKEDGQRITDTLDHIVKMVGRLDQERTFTTEWVKRIERDAENQRQEILKIKQVLNIS